MTTLTTLDAEYADLLRVRASNIPAADDATVNNLARNVDAGSLSLAAATTAVTRLAINTTDVAVLSYQFFTGATPYQGGLDYLVSPTGSNTNSLNSAYYQNFNIENRFINFAVNLGKLGEGAQRFSASYSALSLSDTLVKSYTTIFGSGPSAAQVSSLLNDMVPDGLGGTETRAQYFAYYGGDGLSGLGTKAALVGWLLAQAAKEDVGTYAKANDAFLADLAPDGLARFHVDLVQAYGPQTASSTGATITFSPDQSVSLTSATLGLRSTNSADVITGTGGVNGGQSVATGDGDDTLTIAGQVLGAVTMGNGNDALTITGGLYNTAVHGDPRTIPAYYMGSVSLGAGNDTVFLSNGADGGTSLTASGLNNVLHLGGTSGQPISFGASYSGTISGFQTIYYDAPVGLSGQVIGLQTLIVDVPVSAGAPVVSLFQNVGETVVLQNTAAALSIGAADPNGSTIFLDHYQGAPTTQASINSGFFSADGGFIRVLVQASGDSASSAPNVVTLHVSSDSTAGLIYGYSTGRVLGAGGDYQPLRNLVITGEGSLTAQVSSDFSNVDATGGGDFTLSYTVSTETAAGTAYTNLFRFSNGTDALNVTFAAASAATQSVPSTFVFGLGTDTLNVVGPTLANLSTTSDQTVFKPSEIDGFKKGVDHLVLDAVTTTLTPSVQGFVGTATTLTQALVNVSSHVAATTGAVFEFGGDTYVYQQDAIVGLNTGDGLIRLVGVTGLTTAAGSAVGDIHVHG